MKLNDEHRVGEFAERMKEKWAVGRAKYRNTPEQEFVGDPTQQLMDECIDLANYALEMYFRAQSLGNRMKIVEKGNSNSLVSKDQIANALSGVMFGDFTEAVNWIYNLQLRESRAKND